MAGWRGGKAVREAQRAQGVRLVGVQQPNSRNKRPSRLPQPHAGEQRRGTKKPTSVMNRFRRGLALGTAGHALGTFLTSHLFFHVVVGKEEQKPRGSSPPLPTRLKTTKTEKNPRLRGEGLRGGVARRLPRSLPRAS